MDLPNRSEQDIESTSEPIADGGDPPRGSAPTRGRRLPVPNPWLRYRKAAPLALVISSALIAVVWSKSLSSEAPTQTLAGDGSPSVVAGDPSPSMLAAAEEVSAGLAGAGQVIVVAPGQDAAAPVVVPSVEEPAAAGQGSSSTVPYPPAAPAGTGEAPSSEATTGAPVPASASDGGSTSLATTLPRPDRPTRVFPVNRADRLSTAQLVGLIEAQNITNVADFLSALPPFMGQSYTLMEESRSRHQASTEYPRLIMYGPDARLLIGVSSHPADPLREVVELAELDEGTGLWRFSQLDFRNAFVHDTATESCAGCHGSPQRPIWGEYPNWPGAFAGRDERLAGGQAASLMELKADPIDRFHHLVFPSDHSIQNNGQLYLPSRQYGYANTSFNFELNAAVADGLARRIIGHPNWETEGHRLMAMQWRCDGRYDPATRDAMYNRFGIDGNNDFQLESPLFEANADQRDEYDWNQGSTGLDDSVAFRTLDLAAERDQALEAIVGSERLFVELSNAWFNILGAERAEFLRINGIYEIDFRPQNLSGGFVSQVCGYLESKGA